MTKYLTVLPVFQEILQLQKESLERKVPNVSINNGYFLHMLVRMLRPKNILEIGTANGISTMFFAYALQKNGVGIITSMEPQKESYEEAGENIGKVRLENYVRLLHGPAEELIPDLPGIFDLVFIDGRKKSYKEYFLLALEKSTEQTVFVFDDVVKWRAKMDELFEYVREKKYERMIVPTDPDDGVMILLPTSLDALDLC